MNKGAGRLLIIYDNYTLKKDLIPAWGFSCLVHYPQYRILFDAGGDPSILHRNIHTMGIDFDKIDSVVLSHAHGDHAGGLSAVLQLHPHATICIPESFPDQFKKGLSLSGAVIKEVKEPCMIQPGMYTTGELGKGLKEQSLILKTAEGLVIITGCAHPGIIEIVDHSRKRFNDNVNLLIGGFHLMEYSPKEILAIARELEDMNVQKIAPCHCSGDRTRELLRDHYGGNYVECGAGLVVELPDLTLN